MKNNQFVKVAAVSPRVVVGKPLENVKYFIEELEKLKEKKPAIIVFPELATTGYTVGDLFFQTYLLKQSNDAIHYFLKNNPSEGIVIFGAPIEHQDQLYNTAVVVYRDRVLGIVPKIFLPEYNEFYEKRYFISGVVLGDETVKIDEFNAPMGKLLFYEESKGLTFGIEICEDMYAPVTPGSILSVNGAELIINLSSSNEVLYKDEIRRYLIQGSSRRNHAAYLYASSGRFESTMDTVFSGHNLLVEDGKLLAESEVIAKEPEALVGEIDLGYLKFRRRKSSNLKDSLHLFKRNFKTIHVDLKIDDHHSELLYPLSRKPFVPTANLKDNFEKIRRIQSYGLAKRLEHTKAKSLFVGLSGGLDSTLALLVAYDAFKILDLDLKDLHAITLPGFGTSDRTKNNATILANALGMSFQTISIMESVSAHFKAINHDPLVKDVTYENAQARERTQILMNLANKHQGLMLGTGDLSELALGWCTFNGDQMSNYSVNGGLPKTLVQFMVRGYADYVYSKQEEIKHTLLDILDTPISPELTGTDQQTEAVLGKYEVNDFILYRMLCMGDDEHRIRYLLKKVFKELKDEEVESYLRTFYRRFFTQQFKRSTLPDGPKVIDISLSPRSDWRMPSDAEYEPMK